MTERVDVQQLRDLLDKATPRPWVQSCPPWQPDGRFVYEGSEDPHGRALVADFDPDPEIPDLDSGERDANAALIVVAVNSLPALLARLDALEEVAEAAEVVIREWKEPNPFVGYSIEALRIVLEERLREGES